MLASLQRLLSEGEVGVVRGRDDDLESASRVQHRAQKCKPPATHQVDLFVRHNLVQRRSYFDRVPTDLLRAALARALKNGVQVELVREVHDGRSVEVGQGHARSDDCYVDLLRHVC